MHILVLDSIHGGTILGETLRMMGHTVDLVDVYHGNLTHEGSITPETATTRRYDLLIHPVHLDRAYPLLRRISCPAITHHEAVRWIIGLQIERMNEDRGPVIEVTGTRGKTTTATALASILPGPGILHTSRGTYRYPGEEYLSRMSITPASLITAFSFLRPGEWFIGEVSLGFTGISDLAILTSDEDYRVGANRLSAREIKQMSSQRCPCLVVPGGIQIIHDHVVSATDLVQCSGNVCEYRYREIRGIIENPLISIEGYRTAVQLACAACLLLGFRPDGLNRFSSLPGRLQVRIEDGKTIIDNACSGAGAKTTRDAVSLLTRAGKDLPFSLVIGQENHAVCENFPTSDIISVIRETRPAVVVLVAGDDRIDQDIIMEACTGESIPIHVTNALENGIDSARTLPPSAIVISVKTWR
jgi:hypothetical protein